MRYPFAALVASLFAPVAAIGVAIVPVGAVAAKDPAPVPPPAFRLGDAARPTHYDLRIAVDPRAPTFAGEVAIDLVVARAVSVLWMNATELELDKVEVRQGEREVAVKVVAGGEDFVGLQGRFEQGPARVRIIYRGKIDPVGDEGLFRQQEGGDWYAFSQFESIGARRALPCFDEPQWKTPWRVAIDAPATELAISNAPETSASAIAGRAGWYRHEFAETRALPSYLVALAVGPFDVVEGATAGMKHTPLRYVTPRGRGPEARYAARVTPRLLEELEAYFGMPYPFEKLDSVVVPQLVSFGAMENVGLVTYGSTVILALPGEETPRFREGYSGTAAHELAHMWFGNLVTLAWWDDTWLNEAFASWLGSKVEYAVEPSWDNGVQTGKSRQAALLADRLASARSIAAPVKSRNAIDDAFDDITYNKGEEVLAMFEGWLGPERFRAAARAFIARHAGATATSEDFFRALGEASSDSASALRSLRAFVGQPGAPMIDVALDCATRPALVVSQHRLRPVGSRAPELEWTTPACFAFGAGGQAAIQCASVDRSTRRIELEGARSCPDWILGNTQGRGHYVVRYEKDLLHRNAGKAAALPSKQAQALLRDTALLAESGLVGVDAALDVADAGFTHSSPNVVLAAVALLERLRDDWLTDAQRARKRRIDADRAVPAASALGWDPRESEPDDVRALRPALLRYAADREEGKALRPGALRLAQRWLDDPAGIDTTVVIAVLEVAGRFADADLQERLAQAAASGARTRERFLALGALARVGEPSRRASALGLALAHAGEAPRIDGRGAFYLLDKALADDVNRGAAIGYVLSHVDALEAKLPRDSLAALLVPMGRACTGFERNSIDAVFASRAARYMTGALRLEQALESIDLCIAAHRHYPTAATNSRARSSSFSPAVSRPPPTRSIVSAP